MAITLLIKYFTLFFFFTGSELTSVHSSPRASACFLSDSEATTLLSWLTFI